MLRIIPVENIENTLNKVTEITKLATNEQYPSAKAVLDAISGLTPIEVIDDLSQAQGRTDAALSANQGWQLGQSINSLQEKTLGTKQTISNVLEAPSTTINVNCFSNVFALAKSKLKFTNGPVPFNLLADGVKLLAISDDASFNSKDFRYMDFIFDVGHTSLNFGLSVTSNYSSSQSDVRTGGNVPNLARFGSVLDTSSFPTGITQLSLKCVPYLEKTVPTAAEDLYYGLWPAYRTVTDVVGQTPDENHLEIRYTSNSAYAPYSFNRNIGGLSSEPFILRFSDYEPLSSGTGSGEIAIVLSGYQANDLTKVKAQVPIILIDNVLKAVYLAEAKDNSFSGLERVYKILDLPWQIKHTDNIELKLKLADTYSGLTFRDIEVSLVFYSGNFTQFETTSTGKIPGNLFNQFTYAPSTDKMYISIGGTNNTAENAWSISINSIQNGKYSEFAEGSSLTVAYAGD